MQHEQKQALRKLTLRDTDFVAGVWGVMKMSRRGCDVTMDSPRIFPEDSWSVTQRYLLLLSLSLCLCLCLCKSRKTGDME